jgi:hypothetical protein
MDLKSIESVFNRMPEIFHRNWLRSLNPFTSRYPDDGINEVLQSLFDTALLWDVKKPLFITAADVGRKTLKVFDSSNFDDARIPIWEVVRSAAAAETYFASWKGYADGGVFANNPAMVAVAASSRVLKCGLQDMEILSIGTGKSTQEGKKNPESLFQWGSWLVGALLTGASDDMHDYFVKSLPVKRYERIQFLRDPEWRMDNPADMDKAMSKWAVDILVNVPTVKEF